MTAREWLDAALVRAGAAHDEVVRLCEGKRRFTMTVPVEDTDSDVVLAGPVEDLPRAIAALRAVLHLHAPVDALMNPGRHERLVKVCAGCGTDDGSWQRHPCPTVRAITAALDGAS